ncbi:MAG: hypothetical protein DHS20C18_32790 [Saprospiraceae bacterium]|nr:MAG: hypothetical protein DHS20C18_32790 [Saprospiraceae bacterium]
MNTTPVAIFQDRLGIASNDCIRCHDDVHEEKFGNNCVQCHNENSFQEVNTNNFNHNLTDFTLVGKHEVVDCRQCHTTSFVEPLPHNECAACHQDYHEGEFLVNNINRDCATCHTEDGFEVTLYTFDDHNKTDFPLDGAHLATPCFACHVSEDKWTFRNIGEGCVDCHEDIHAGYIAEKYYPNHSCEKCHATASWGDNHFDHSLTDFNLSGAHAEQNCMTCHAVADENPQNRYAGFTDVSSTCISCHENVHDQQFEQNGITDCARCHSFEGWAVSDFNHNNTAFKLEGKHAEIACNACHKPVTLNDKTFTKYQFDSFECVVCHQ